MTDKEQLKVDASNFTEAIDALIARMDAATAVATSAAGNQLVSAAVGNFEGAHAVGFPHVGGTKPNTVTGNLQRSIKAQPVRSAGAYRYSVTVGPHAIYSRIIELGGRITPKKGPFLVWTLGPRPSSKEGWRAAQKAGLVRRARSVTISPHPYFSPAVVSVARKLPQLFIKYWDKAING